MGLGLVILGTLFGFLSASIAVVSGQLGFFAGLGLYCATGVLSVLLGTAFIAFRTEKDANNAPSGTHSPVPVTR